MGEGHNATGRALDEAVRELWPDVRVRWLDTLEVMGRGVGPVFRQIYVTNVAATALAVRVLLRLGAAVSAGSRGRPSGSSARGAAGGCAGTCASTSPTSSCRTYPLGSAGLAWLRRHRDLRTPMGAWVSDFSPHPFWVYHELDLNLVMHPVAVEPARTWVPGLPVRCPRRRSSARSLPVTARPRVPNWTCRQDKFVALVSCGAFGFGSVETAARTLLAASDDVVVVVACGRNDALRSRLLAGGDHGGRLRALGWTDQMPALTVASDVVVTNAGGATSLEALACGRPVLMYRPIAAHGKANAA